MNVQALLRALALSALATTGFAQEVGTRFPAEIELDGFGQIPAESFDDLFGRAVLIEFFAYW